MLIPRHWRVAEGSARDPTGRRFALRVWGWSEGSPGEAAAMARERLAAVRARLDRGEAPREDYGYGRAPLREEIVHELGRAGTPGAAVVTRNRYGALVLNTARVPFVDVDVPAPGLGSRIARLLRRAPDVDPALARIRATCAAALGGDPCRVYRTPAGYRLLLTGRLLDPCDDSTRALLERFGADPHFVRLCRQQESFRARLTPKPWRCGLPLPPGQYPRDDAGPARDFAGWLASYETTCEGYAACRYLETLGSGWERSEAERVVEEHDRVTRALRELPLA